MNSPISFRIEPDANQFTDAHPQIRTHSRTQNIALFYCTGFRVWLCFYHRSKTHQVEVTVNTFGEFLKEKRIQKGLTLRQCCADLKVDPSNWSKLERGINPAPKDERLVESWSEFFDLDFTEAERFRDLAALSRNEIPADMASDEKVLSMLPVFFRAARGNKLEGDKLHEFFEDIRKLNSPDKE